MRIASRTFAAILTPIILLFVTVTDLSAQDPHTIHATINTPPSGPSSNFTVNLTMSPADIDIVAFDIIVGYDNTQATLVDIVDNTNQPQADVLYDTNSESALSGVSYANVFVPIVMSVVDPLLDPVNLAQLNFTTTSTYNDPENDFFVYLDKWTPSGGMGGLAGYVDGRGQRIPTLYDSLEPADAAVSDWTLY